MTKISAVIPLYKSDFYIKGAVESVLNQDMDDYELILVSDGSPGREREILTEYEGRFRFIEIPHGGIANAWNVGFRAAKGEYFTWFGADDRHFPNSFRIMSQCLDENKDVGMVYPDVVRVRGADIYSDESNLMSWQGIFTWFDKFRGEIIDKLKGKKVVIYGAGTVAKYVYYQIKNRVNIQAVIDRDTRLHFSKFEDEIDILPLESLGSLGFDCILITPLKRKDEISGILENYIGETGLKKAIFFDDLLKPSSPRLCLEEPVNLLHLQEVFNRVDELTFKYDSTHVDCRVWRKSEFSMEELLRRNFMTTIFMYRREVRDVIGEYDTSYEIVMDYDYWLRISEKFKVLHIPELLGIVYIGEDCYHRRMWDTGTRELQKLMTKTLKRRGLKRSWHLIGHEFHFSS